MDDFVNFTRENIRNMYNNYEGDYSNTDAMVYEFHQVMPELSNDLIRALIHEYQAVNTRNWLEEAVSALMQIDSNWAFELGLALHAGMLCNFNCSSPLDIVRFNNELQGLLHNNINNNDDQGYHTIAQQLFNAYDLVFEQSVINGTIGENWSQEQHLMFLRRLQAFGPGMWTEIALGIPGKTPEQVLQHFQEVSSRIVSALINPLPRFPL